jgi:predicted phage tail protein
MSLFKRTIGAVLILSVLGLYFPNISFARQGQYFARADSKEGITKHAPEILAPPEEKIPVEVVEKKKRKTWYWVLGGVVLVGAIAAAGGGGGGGGGGGDGGSKTGDVKVSW